MTELWNRLLTDVAALGHGENIGLDCLCINKRSASDASCVEQMAACEAMLRLTEPPATWDPKAVAVLIVGLTRCHAYLSKLTSVPVFFEAVLESLRIRAAWQYGPLGFMYQPNDEAAIAVWLKSNLKLLKGNVLAQCKEIASARWPTATLGQRWTIARVLPDEEAWAKEVVEQALSDADLKITVPNLCEIVCDVEQAERVVSRGPNAVDYDALRRNLGVAVIPLLVKAVDSILPRRAERIAHLLVSFDESRAAEALVHCLAKKPLRPIAAAYFEKGSVAARAALKAVVNGEATRKEGTRVASIAQDLLSRLEQGSSTEGDDVGEEASLDEMPRVLVEPPWKIFPVEARPTPPAISLGVLEIPKDVEERVAIDPIAVSRAAALLAPEELTATDEQLLEKWSLGQIWANKPVYAWVLDRLGLTGIAAFEKFFSYVPELCLSIDSPRIADIAGARVAAFDYRGRSQQPCVFALRWLHRYPIAATIGLVPHLATKSHAARALSIIATRHDVGAIIRTHYGDAIAASALELIGGPGRELGIALPTQSPKHDVVSIETLTRPRLSSGKRFPKRAMTSLLDMIWFSDTRFPFSGIAEVRAVSDPRSLAELAWDLACAWEVRQTGGRRGWRARQENAKLDWLLYALVHFADEEIVRRLTPRFNGVEIVDVLGQIGTDAAVLELLTIFAREKDKQHADLRNRVHQQLMLVAARRGLPTDELEEAVLPDPVRVGASVIDGRPVIDYGPRHFEVRWTEDLAAGLVVDDAKRTAPVSRRRGGKPHLSKRLPATRKTDDPVKVARAKEVWATIVEDVAAVIARRVELLSRAMEQGRQWTITELRRRYIDPPLLAHLARGLLFLRDGDPATKVFRVAEDASFADIDDAVVVLDPGDHVRLIKANDLSPEDVTRWRTTFFDYGLIMPIAQLPAET